MVIFENYGCRILLKNERYFIQYDSGESSGSRLIENEISYEQALVAMKSEMDAYRIILAAERN